MTRYGWGHHEDPAETKCVCPPDDDPDLDCPVHGLGGREHGTDTARPPGSSSRPPSPPLSPKFGSQVTGRNPYE